MRDPIVYSDADFHDLLDGLSYNPDAQYFLSEQKLAALERETAGLAAINDLRGRLLHQRRNLSRGVALNAQQSSVKSLISLVSAEYGLDPTYFHGLAHRESRFNPFAGAQTSSARGLWQFTENTWLCSLKEYGASYGLSGADQIRLDGRGNCTVADQKLKSRLLALRYNEQFSTHIVIAHTLENRSYLRGHGVSGNQADLYTLHFLGQNDGLKFLQANPYQLGVSIVPKAAAANPSVFYTTVCNDRHQCTKGRPKQVWEIYSSFYSL